MPPVPLARPQAPTPASTRQFRFTIAQRQAVIDAYEAGATMASLAKQYGVKRESISKLLRRADVTIRQSHFMAKTEIDLAAQLYESGQSLQRIADRLGWDHKTIYRQLKKRGVTMRGPNDWQIG